MQAGWVLEGTREREREREREGGEGARNGGFREWREHTMLHCSAAGWSCWSDDEKNGAYCEPARLHQ